MNNMKRMIVGVLAISMLATVAFGAQKNAPTCPVCKMTLSKKKTKMNTVAVKIHGKTYYCCAACKMDAKKK